MPLTLDQLEFLRTPAAEELLAMELPGDPLRAVVALRKRCEPDQAAAVETLRGLRHRAHASGRFPGELAARLLATDALLQQASSFRLAVYKGGRLAELARQVGCADGEILDLCCGLGADAVGMARAALRVRGVDVAPEAVVCARHNAAAAGVAERCRFDVADAAAVELPAAGVVHVDPDRRAAGKRSVHLSDGSPGEAFLRALPNRTRAGAMKLSPAIEWTELTDLPVDELEYVSERGVCKQLLAWWGTPGPVGSDRPRRRATVVGGEIDRPRVASLAAGEAPYADIAAPGEWLIEPDPALIAAQAVDDLAAAEGLWRLAAGLVWLSGGAPVDTPLAHSFRVLADVPGREREVARALRKLDAGRVEIKPRGVKLDTDALQRRLRGRGRRPVAVLWGRLGQKQRAFLCERATSGKPA